MCGYDIKDDSEAIALMATAKESETQWSPMLTAHDERDGTSHALPPPMTTTLSLPTAATSTAAGASSSPIRIDASTTTRLTTKRSPARKKEPATATTATASHTAGKSLIQSIWDEDEMKKAIVVGQHQQQQQQCSQLGAATSSLAKFKAAQDVSLSYMLQYLGEFVFQTDHELYRFINHGN